MRVFALVLSLMVPFQTPLAQLRDENLIQELPDGYKVGSEMKIGSTIMTRMVPSNESVNDWNDIVITTILLGNKTMTPNGLREMMQKQRLII